MKRGFLLGLMSVWLLPCMNFAQVAVDRATQHQLKYHIVNPQDITGLRSLSRAFLSNPEYVGQGLTNQTPLSNQAFDGVANAFGKRFSNYAAFNDPTNWIGQIANNSHLNTQDANFFDENESAQTVRYVQKLKLPADAIIFLMGDLHGSVHSLIRSLWRLVALGYLNEDLSIKKPNFYMIFLGDYVDRGRWGVEVVTTLMMLKLKNWDNVHLVAGNHETGKVPMTYGFSAEITNKFGSDSSFWVVYKKMFMNLPVALFIECNGSFVQCCHGGIDAVYNPLVFLQDSRKLFENVGSEANCMGLFWSDFCAGQSGCIDSHRGVGIVADQQCTQEYLRDNPGLKAIMRAHMDMEFGLKLFLAAALGAEKSCLNEQQLTATRPQPHVGYLDPGTYQYEQDCLYHWTEAAKKLGISGNKFALSMFNYYPVFTFTSAVEPRQFPFDCFGLMSTGNRWDDWMMEVYELFLDVKGQHYRNNKFVNVGFTSVNGDTNLVKPSDQQGKDPITVVWQPVFNEQTLIDGMTEIVTEGNRNVPVRGVVHSVMPHASSNRQDLNLKPVMIDEELSKLRCTLNVLRKQLELLAYRLSTLRKLVVFNQKPGSSYFQWPTINQFIVR